MEPQQLQVLQGTETRKEEVAPRLALPLSLVHLSTAVRESADMRVREELLARLKAKRDSLMSRKAREEL